MTGDPDLDVVVVGAGIVGLATARALNARDPDRRIAVIDKESTPAHHQSGRNSGVIHSGVYYRPDSEKTALVDRGRTQLIEFAESKGIPYEICGKVIVAVDDREIPRLADLETRAAANRIPTRRLSVAELREREPHIAGVDALLVPSAGIIDFGAICTALVEDLEGSDIEIRLDTEVTTIDATPEAVEISTHQGPLRSRTVVNCAGLHSDRVARRAGVDQSPMIMPFRGEYRELRESARSLVRDLVYPVPDPAFPFLGVHLTRMIDGTVHAGPNAVPALHREGYRWRDVSARDVGELAFSARTWRLARRYWRTGLGEIHRSLSSRAFLAALRRLCPDLTADDLVPSDSGVRAQAITRDGRLLDDFAFVDGERTVHVVNAPSPAATASFAIGEHIARRHDLLPSVRR